MTDRLITHKNLAVLALIVLIAAAIPGISRLHIEPDASTSLLPETGYDADIYLQYKDRFPADFGALLVVSGDICRTAVWEWLRDLTKAVEHINMVDRVFSLTNAPYVTGEGDTVVVGDFSDTVIATPSKYCDLAVAYEPYLGLLINSEGSATALYLIADKSADAIGFTEKLRETLLAREMRARELGVEVYHSGELLVSAELSRQTEKSSNLIGAVMLIMALITWMLSGSPRVGILAAATGALGVYFTFALMGYLEITQTPINVLMANMLIPLGAAFALHALHYVKHAETLHFGFLPNTAIRPFLFATVSTTVGFGCTAISHSPDIQEFGTLGMFGISACLVATVLGTFPLLAKLRSNSSVNLRFRFPVLMVSKSLTTSILIGLILLSAYGLSHLRVNYGPVDYLPDTNEVRQQVEKVGEQFALYSMPLVISAGEKDGVVDTELWENIRQFVVKQETRTPGLRFAWLYEQVEALGYALNADEATPEEFPGDDSLLSQMLLLFDPNDTTPYISFYRDTLVLVLQSPFRNSTALRDFEGELINYFGDTRLDTDVTGRIANFFRVGEQIATDNLESLVLGLLLVFLLFLGIVRKTKTALIATKDKDTAITLTLANYGAPVTTTTIAIIFGFSVMNLAGLVPFHTFSQLLSATVAYALLCDLFLLPNLLNHYDAST